MSELTFRNFAESILKRDDATAHAQLQELLGLPPEQAVAATEHFKTKMKEGPAEFMPKAMGLRHAVTSGSDDDIAKVLEEVFGLTGDSRTTAVAAVRRRYPVS